MDVIGINRTFNNTVEEPILTKEVTITKYIYLGKEYNSIESIERYKEMLRKALGLKMAIVEYKLSDGSEYKDYYLYEDKFKFMEILDSWYDKEYSINFKDINFEVVLSKEFIDRRLEELNEFISEGLNNKVIKYMSDYIILNINYDTYDIDCLDDIYIKYNNNKRG